MSTLGALGEDRLVAMLTRQLPTRPDVHCGAGDDCAVVGAPRAARWTLLKTDAVLEGVHFLPTEKPHRVGWKALCRAISDVAAMGGEPRHALITLAAAPSTSVRTVQGIYRGITKAAQRFGVAVVGGETCRSPGPLFLSVALTGEVERRRCVLRSGGEPGDALWVTGRLGGSLAGKHLDFVPRVAEARWLTEHFPLHAMMDVSDGVGADLPRLAAASGCGYQLDAAEVPRTRGCSLEQALGDGEDFELLFALPARHTAALRAAWPKAFPRLPLSCIGALTDDLTLQPPSTRGFDHFSKP